MRRLLTIALIASTLAVGPAAAARADAGAPGTTFPEAPGENVASACETVQNLPDVGGGTTNNETAFAIISGILADACFGG